jgi:uncharacterized protein YjiS (DUF1127 family)
MAYIHAHTANTALKLSKRTQFPVLSIWAIQVANTVVTWDDRYKARRALQTMTREHLNDMGMTPEQARREAGKPFWRP